MNNNFESSYNFTQTQSKYNFETVDQELENEKLTILDLLATVLIDNKKEFFDSIDLDNFSFLSLALLKFVSENLNALSIEFTENNTKGKIILKKEIGLRNIELFSKIFETLTLNRLKFMAKEDQWECQMLF